MRSLKTILETHAVILSITKFVKNEVIEQQLYAVASNQFRNALDIDAFVIETGLIVTLSYIAWISSQYVNDDIISKLELINDYRKNRKFIQNFIFVCSFIFLRNVENAI
jgi:hypothetical protein